MLSIFYKVALLTRLSFIAKIIENLKNSFMNKIFKFNQILISINVFP